MQLLLDEDLNLFIMTQNPGVSFLFGFVISLIPHIYFHCINCLSPAHWCLLHVLLFCICFSVRLVTIGPQRKYLFSHSCVMQIYLFIYFRCTMYMYMHYFTNFNQSIISRERLHLLLEMHKCISLDLIKRAVFQIISISRI